MFDKRNRIKEAFKLSKTEAEVLMLLSEEGFRTHDEFWKLLFITGTHLRKKIVVLRKKGFDIYSIFGIGYTMSPDDRRRVTEAGNRP